ncbi:MAG: hypothetical protein AAF135_00635 [Bacteroidota bacterium]
MKLRCTCGHIIQDSSDYLPYKGYIFPDPKLDNFLKMAEDLTQFFYAVSANEKKKWLAENFSEIYPDKLDNVSVAYDIIMSHYDTQYIYECENCGRIWIEDFRNKREKRYRSFYAEEEGSKGILSQDPHV